ncbi:MAG TPA: cell division regulator GpsB [Candidatus Nosocomiicoccus stercorigallinarum]|nr:cell division regulator GpsB [Candidatus Nosocomiicoccus stercorigallinarum]
MSEYSLNLSAKDIFEKEFEKTIRGYQPIEVDTFLDDVIADYQRMADMNKNLQKLEEENKRLKKEVEELRIRVATRSRSDVSDSQNQHIDILKRLSNLEKKVFGHTK